MYEKLIKTDGSVFLLIPENEMEVPKCGVSTPTIADARLKYPIGTKVKCLFEKVTSIVNNNIANDMTSANGCIWLGCDSEFRICQVYDANTNTWAEIIDESAELLEEARRRYPVGTKVKCLFSKEPKTVSENINISPYRDMVDDDTTHGNANVWLCAGKVRVMVYSGKWAEIIPTIKVLPESIEEVYEEVKPEYYIEDYGKIVKCESVSYDNNLTPSEKSAEKVLAFMQLLNIQHFCNEGCEGGEWGIIYDCVEEKYVINNVTQYASVIDVTYIEKEHAQQVIEKYSSILDKLYK